MFFEFPGKIYIFLEPKIIAAQAIEVNTTTIVSIFCS
jgi:hypothetical protein